MFGIGAFELFAILVIALIVLGPDRLPKAMGTVGKWVRELRRITRDFRREFDEEIQMLQGEMEMLREEAELTRKELDGIRADIQQSMTEVQGEFQQVGEDIRVELGGAEADALGTGAVPLAGTAWPGSPSAAAGSPAAARTNGPVMDPTDAMYLAIVESFAQENGQLQAQASRSDGDRRGDGALVDLGTDWERIQNEATRARPAAGLGTGQSIAAFAPRNGQFGALLKVIAGSGQQAVKEARAALAAQAARDAADLSRTGVKGAAGLAFAWAAQRQALMDEGTVAVDTSADGIARIRLRQCPYGLTGPDGLPVCELSNVYDLELAGQMGLRARYEQRLTDGAPDCLMIIEAAKPEPVPEPASIQAEKPALPGSDETLAGAGTAESLTVSVAGEAGHETPAAG